MEGKIMAAMAGQSSSETRSTGPIDPTSAARITFTSALPGVGGEVELSSTGVLPVTVAQELVETSVDATQVGATTFGVGTGTYSWVFAKEGFTRQMGAVSVSTGESKNVSVSVTPE